MISIIIPTFNNGSQLGETLSSVLVQSSNLWECLIVDDGSNDVITKDIVESFLNKDDRFRYFQRPINRLKGANACRNIGIEQALGKYVMFLDADDLLSKDCILNRLKKKDDHFVSIFPMGTFNISVHEDIKIVNRHLVDNSSYLEMFLSYQTPWPITSLLIPKNLIKIKFSEKLNRFQDIDFSIRLILDLGEDCFRYFDDSPDSFYRRDLNNLKKFKDPQFIVNVVTSFYILMEQLIPHVILLKNEETLKPLAIFYNRIFESYIRGNEKLLEQWPPRIRNLLYQNKIITFKEMVFYNIKSISCLKSLINFFNLLKK